MSPSSLQDPSLIPLPVLFMMSVHLTFMYVLLSSFPYLFTFQCAHECQVDIQVLQSFEFLPTNISWHVLNLFMADSCGEESMRSLWGHKHSCTQYSAGWDLAQPQPQKRARRHDAAQLLFLSCYVQRSRNTGSSYYNLTPLPENCCSSSLFPPGYKRLAEGGRKAF
jgi:hypothetical protein